MLRDKSLVPLSRQHQHALALCVRIVQASPICETDLDTWQAEVAQHFQQEIAVHFAAEEAVLFPAAVRLSTELASLVDELLAEHATLRRDFSRAETRTMSAQDLLAFAQRLSSHIRKEERELFERTQGQIAPDQLETLGIDLEGALKDVAKTCMLPVETTRVRATK